MQYTKVKRTWLRTSYSPLPRRASLSSRDLSTMSSKDGPIALNSRSEEHITRINSSVEHEANGTTAEIEDSPIYRVYKRRWIGVVLIMLLNIISSWRYDLACAYFE